MAGSQCRCTAITVTGALPVIVMDIAMGIITDTTGVITMVIGLVMRTENTIRVTFTTTVNREFVNQQIVATGFLHSR